MKRKFYQRSAIKRHILKESEHPIVIWMEILKKMFSLHYMRKTYFETAFQKDKRSSNLANNYMPNNPKGGFNFFLTNPHQLHIDQIYEYHQSHHTQMDRFNTYFGEHIHISIPS